MASAVYILGILITAASGLLLLRGYIKTRKRLLFWSAVCFFGLSVSHFMVFLDLVIFPDVNLYPLRLGTAALAMLLLLYGLIWEGD